MLCESIKRFSGGLGNKQPPRQKSSLFITLLPASLLRRCVACRWSFPIRIIPIRSPSIKTIRGRRWKRYIAAPMALFFTFGPAKLTSFILNLIEAQWLRLRSPTARPRSMVPARTICSMNGALITAQLKNMPGSSVFYTLPPIFMPPAISVFTFGPACSALTLNIK